MIPSTGPAAPRRGPSPAGRSVGDEQQPRQHDDALPCGCSSEITGYAANLMRPREARRACAPRERRRQQVGAQRREHELQHADEARDERTEHDPDPGERDTARSADRRAAAGPPTSPAPRSAGALPAAPAGRSGRRARDEAGVRLEHVGGRQRLRWRGYWRLLERDEARRDDLVPERRRREQTLASARHRSGSARAQLPWRIGRAIVPRRNLRKGRDTLPAGAIIAPRTRVDSRSPHRVPHAGGRSAHAPRS